MLIADLVATHAAVAATRSRKAKSAALAATLGAADRAELPVVTSWLGGALLQRRTGLGWRGLQTMPHSGRRVVPDGGGGARRLRRALDVDRVRLPGRPGRAVAELFGRATEDEQRWLRGLVTGEVRQGALDALVQEALAAAAGVPLKAVRRAAMLAGSTVAVAVAAFEGEEALAAIGLEVGRPVLPMLASSATDVAAAFAKVAPDGGPVAVDTKLDGIRIQVHRDGDDVRIATRSLDDITHRLPEVVALARSLPAERFVLDGEAIALDDAGRPRPFQETASRTAQDSGVAVSSYFFDVLHLDGRDLLDAPGSERLDALTGLVPESSLVARLVTDDPAEAEAFATRVVAAGHEGVVVKSLSASYDAGRRGAGWVKVKPVHTLDLVVLADRVGLGPARGLALQHPPRRPRRVLGVRLRDARQDVQGHDRRDAGVADRAVHRARDLAGRPLVVRRPGPARAGRRDRLRRTPALHPLPRRPRAPVRPGRALPRRQDRRRGRHDRDGARPGRT